MKCRYFCRLPLDISPVYLTRGISKALDIRKEDKYEAKKKNRTMAFFIARTCGLCVDCSFPNASNYWLQLYGLEWNRRKNICRLEKLQPNAVR